MKIILSHENLYFVSPGNRKMHAMNIKQPELTMCGVYVPPGTVPHMAGKYNAERLCGRCMAAMRLYWLTGKVKLEEVGKP